MQMTSTREERIRIVRGVQWRGWASAMVGNCVAGTALGTILAVAAPMYFPEIDPATWVTQSFEIGVPFFLVISVGTWLASRIIIQRRYMPWFVEGRPASPQERKRLASLPWLAFVINVIAWTFMWAGHYTYFVHVEHYTLPGDALPKLIAIYAFCFVLGTALAYLLLERVVRPYLLLALPREISLWPSTLGLGPRLLIAWFTVSGAPLILIIVIWTGLSSDQMVLGASALRITAALAVVIGLVVFVIAGRRITGPLRRLQDAQRLVARGDLSPRVEVEEAAEIGHLEMGFNQMVDGLAALSSDNEHLQAELRMQLEAVQASRVRIVEAADAERARIERNLHDGAQQRLLSVSFALRAAQRRSDDSDLDRAASELDAAMADLRELARGIHPAILDEEGLGPALTSLAERASVPTDVDAQLNGRLPVAAEVTAYFVTAECLANIARYARASRASIRAAIENGALRLEVEDDGIGGAEPGRGSGLRGLSDRVSALGGSLDIDSPPDGGTRILAVIPCV